MTERNIKLLIGDFNVQVLEIVSEYLMVSGYRLIIIVTELC